MATRHDADGPRAAAAVLLLLLLRPAAAGPRMPYVPAQVLTAGACLDDAPCRGRDVALVFAPGDGGVQLLALNYSAGIDAGAAPHSVARELPFLRGDAPHDTAFGAARAADGQLVVYAGACGAGAGTVWTLDPDAGADGWWRRDTKAPGDGARAPFFLGGTLAFSARLAPAMDRPTVYAYGGMCPAPGAAAADWQANATYTKTMVSLAPDDSGYELGVAPAAGPRVPFAGFTLTQLRASTANASGAVTQQASFVVLGGHTPRAFINMSTAAVWSLPEESWSYVRIQGAAVDSRSGHSAVLSSDGRALVVLGGWVGDVDTPADPQLAVLELSPTYSSWRWRIPDQQPPGPGLFGHGAALLPGNVMMVYGGWETPAPAPGTQARRQAAPAGPRFLNLSSMTWTASYRNPDADRAGRSGSSEPAAPDAAGSLPTARRLGLGLGLGLGFALLVAAAVAALAWRRRRRRHRAAEAALHDDKTACMAERHGADDAPSPWGRRDWWAAAADPQAPAGYESLRGDGAAPAAAVARKPVPRILGRGAYAPAEARFGVLASPPGVIHPILEDDEEDLGQAALPLTPTSDAPSDPFLTPTGVPPPSPGRGPGAPSPERRDPDVHDWVSDVDAADALLARYSWRASRASPTRRNSGRSAHDDESRTASTLSDGGGAESLRQHAGAKPGSSSSSSYATARSGFGALQAEAPGLLLGTPRTDDEAEDEAEPGSPSKAKPAPAFRRGWLGSLRRVFSGAGSGASSPATPTATTSAGSDYEPPRLGGLSGELLRRRQGRLDWEAEDPAAADNEWDIERAAEQRLVQVMFTVPRERLRVVNADAADADAAADAATLEEPRVAELVDPAADPDRAGGLLHPPDATSESRLSHSTDGSGRRSPGRVFTAEAVTLERPRTRVLQMVDTIEGHSRPSSPGR